MREISTKKVTIFACLKLRGQGEASCGGRGARDILERLRSGAEELGSVPIEVRASGCLDRCKKGPIVVVLLKGKDLKKPPKKAWKKADARFKRLKVEDAAGVLKAAESLLKK